MAECQPLQHTLRLALSTAGFAEWLGTPGEALPLYLLCPHASQLQVWKPEMLTAL